MKTDLRVFLSYVVLGLICASFLLNIRGCDSDRLEKENRALQHRRDSLTEANLRLRATFDSLDAAIRTREARIAELETEAKMAGEAAHREKGKADAIKAQMAETQRRLDWLRKNPANRKDEELIKSLKNKLDKR